MYYATTRFFATIIFNVSLGGIAINGTELVTLIATWSRVSDLDSFCRVERSVQYIMLTVMALLALLLSASFVVYALQRNKKRAFLVLRIATFAMWPLGLSWHARDLLPAGSLDSTRNFCFTDFAAMYDIAIIGLVAIIMNVGSLVVWLVLGRWATAPFAVYIKNVHRLVGIFIGIVPASGLLLFVHLQVILGMTARLSFRTSPSWPVLCSLRSLGGFETSLRQSMARSV
jgi:hypothetical protein